jgi:segregation and condensation protein B
MSDAPEPDATEPAAEVAPEGAVDPQHLRLLEAVLFAATEPVPTERLAAFLPEATDLEAVLAALVEKYAQAGVVPVRVGTQEGGMAWMFRTADDLGPILAGSLAPPRKLTRAAVETLAVIAWHQPVTRSDIETLRGASIATGLFETLTEAELIRPAGRRETPGRPVLWATTEKFLAHFGLAGLADLPDARQVRELGLGLFETAEAEAGADAPTATNEAAALTQAADESPETVAATPTDAPAEAAPGVPAEAEEPPRA